jgi:drug/metabolite transporter (DMT)-like permease
MSEQLALTLIAASVGFVAAVFFCMGNAFNSVDKITYQSTTFWDASEPIARALASQRAQYITGALLLLLYFALQILAALASPNTPITLPQILHNWLYLVLSAIIPTTILASCFCYIINRLTLQKVLQRHKEFLKSQE